MENKTDKKIAKDYGGCLNTFVPREIKPFSVFMLKSDDITENYKNFIEWIHDNFSPFVEQTCVFRNDAKTIYVKCVCGDPSFGEGKIEVKRLSDENVYVKVEGASLPYCVNYLKFLDTYRYAPEGTVSYGSPRHEG